VAHSRNITGILWPDIFDGVNADGCGSEILIWTCLKLRFRFGTGNGAQGFQRRGAGGRPQGVAGVADSLTR
jgi:hypothetical protein